MTPPLRSRPSEPLPSRSAACAKPRLVVLATGGTIAGGATMVSRGDASYRSAVFPIQQLLAAVPPLRELAALTGEQVCNIGSQAMNHEVWLRLAQRCNALLASVEVDGVVITHGTDTLEETAYFLSLVVKSHKPLVLVGSMRPATAIGADGPANLYNAVAVAADPRARGRGPLVVLHDLIHYARETTKTHTTLLDTFESPNRGLAGVVRSGTPIFHAPHATRHTLESEFSIEDLLAAGFPYVEILYSYASVGGGLIDASVAAGARGIVLAGVGAGNTTDAALAALRRAAAAGVVVCRSTRVGRGSVERNLEIDDETCGFIASLELSPQKARILLMLGLTRTAERDALQRLFAEY